MGLICPSANALLELAAWKTLGSPLLTIFLVWPRGCTALGWEMLGLPEGRNSPPPHPLAADLSNQFVPWFPTRNLALGPFYSLNFTRLGKRQNQELRDKFVSLKINQ